MKIAIFGDSFADKNAEKIWWRYLQDFGHAVTSFGECGSSIAFSAGELWTHYDCFDFSIWCVSSSNRVSFYHDDVCYHVTNAFDQGIDSPDAEHLKSVARQYLGKVYHPHGHEVVNHLAVHGALNHYKNLMIIPCFDTPVYFMTGPRFNLYNLSTIEARHYFPNQDLYEIYGKYIDLRHGHFTPNTQQTLSVKINNAIKKKVKIFCAEYSDFPVPNDPLVNVFCLR